MGRSCLSGGAVDATHSMPIKKVRLRGVFGRKAASIAGFNYSEALQKKSIQWDESNLDKWLTDPDAMVPDTDMAFRVKDADERKALIAYLKGL